MALLLGFIIDTGYGVMLCCLVFCYAVLYLEFSRVILSCDCCYFWCSVILNYSDRLYYYISIGNMLSYSFLFLHLFKGFVEIFFLFEKIFGDSLWK